MTTSEGAPSLATRLVQRLAELAEPNHPDRGALAALRRLLSEAPASALEAYRHVPLLAGVPEAQERWYLLIAGLFALHPAQTQEGGQSLGLAFRSAVRREEDRDAVERRFVTLLKAHPDDLPTHLRSAVSFLKSREVAIDYEVLVRDVLQWGQPDMRVQRRWARHFWSTPSPANETAPPNDAGSGDGSDGDDQ